MFSQDAYDNPKIIEVAFLVGLNNEQIHGLLTSQMSINLNAEILFSFPDNKTAINSHVLDFIYPCGVNISFSEVEPKFNAIILTNEKGIRTYIYVLKFYEKITESFINSESEKETLLNQESFRKFNNNKKILLDSSITRNSSLINNNNFKRNFYAPIAICLCSSFSSNDFFRKILIEFHNIMKSSVPSNFKNEMVRNYRFCEFFNYMVFLNNVLKPPPNTQLTLNLHFSNVTFYSPSYCEIPFSKDSFIKILFNTLEISIILKLFLAILSEKQIIFIASQNYLIYNITEALQRLIFPLKWIHTYIPVLPMSQYDYLDAPTPYIMGVLSYTCDYDILKEKYPNNVICDINTSQIYDNYILALPYELETKVLKKIQLIKNPEKSIIEEISPDLNNKDFTNISDNFEQNILIIFFEILKDGLGNYKKYLDDKNIFCSQKFLDDQKNDEYKDFWEKIINTQIFEYFIICNQYLDDSTTKIFNNILKYHQKKSNNNSNESIFSYSMNLPFNISSLFSEFEKRARIIDTFKRQDLFEYIDKCRKYVKNYNIVSTERMRHKNNNNNNNSKNLKKKNLSDKNLIKLFEITDFYLKPKDILYEYGRKKIPLNESLNISLLNKTKESPDNQGFKFEISFSFYGKNGFLQFIRDLLQILNINEISEIDYQIDILKELNNFVCINQQTTKETFFEKIDEVLEDFEFDNSIDDANNSFSYSPQSNQRKNKPIIEIANTDQYQFKLVLAYYLDYLTNKNDTILDLFNEVVESNAINFPKIRFYNFLEKFDLNKLRFIYSTSKNKLISKITNLKIQNLLKTTNIFQNSEKLIQTESDSINSEAFFRSESSFILDEKNEKQLDFTNSDSIDIIRKFKDVINDSTTYNLKLNDSKQYKKQSMRQMNNYMKLDEDETPRVRDRNNSYKKTIGSVIKNTFDGRINGKSIIDNMKLCDSNLNEKIRTLTIINNFKQKTLIKKDPISLIEDISLKIFSLISKNALNKYKPELLNTKLYLDLMNTKEFKSIQKSIGQLQSIDINILLNYNQNTALCFWINAFNFLTIFTIIYKKEILMNNYEWYRFLKGSNYNLGGFEFSLYEIEYCIIKNKINCQSIYYAQKSHFTENDIRKKFELKLENLSINFGLFYPLKLTPSLAIYFPSNIFDSLNLNAIEYFSKYLVIDSEKKTLSYPEFLNLIDSSFIYNFINYKNLIAKDLFEVLEELNKEISITTIKFDWMINFCNIKGI